MPGVGELIGGSQREERYDKLKERLTEMKLEEEDYGVMMILCDAPYDNPLLSLSFSHRFILDPLNDRHLHDSHPLHYRHCRQPFHFTAVGNTLLLSSYVIPMRFSDIRLIIFILLLVIIIILLLRILTPLFSLVYGAPEIRDRPAQRFWRGF